MQDCDPSDRNQKLHRGTAAMQISIALAGHCAIINTGKIVFTGPAGELHGPSHSLPCNRAYSD